MRTDATAPAVTEIYNEIRKMKDVEVTMDELTLGKDSLVRSMPGRFETTAQTVDSFATLFVYNLGLDYYSKYIERVGSLDAAAVHAAARKHLLPERMLVVAVGDRQKIEGGADEAEPRGDGGAGHGRATSSSLSRFDGQPLQEQQEGGRRENFFTESSRDAALRLEIRRNTFLLPSCPSCRCSWLAAAGRIS